MITDLAHLDPAWAWSPYEPDAQRPWNRARAAHLYRRAGFAANSQQLDDAAKQQPAALVQQLVEGVGAEQFQRDMNQLGATILAGGNAENLSAWWLYRMLYTPDQLLEKTTLFWHGHFATSAAKVNDVKPMLAQNDLLRRQARGDFNELVHAMSRDPAMLVYLDSATNRKARPNENYARELMELFCLGPGNYTEADIKQIARCFTGWEVNRGQFRFDEYQHDDGGKSFLGRSGNFNGDDAVRVVLEQPAAPRFIAAKLIRFFVCDEPQPPAALVEPLANQLRRQDFNIAPVLGTILGSQFFFSEHSIARKIRSPVEMGVGLLRSLQGTTNIYRLAEELSQLGQALFYPPNVKGWDGGRAWINSSTLLARANLVRRLVHDEQNRFAGGNLESLADRQGLKTPEQTVDWLLDLLVAAPLPPASREQLLQVARDGGRDRSQRIANVIHVIGTMPEFQLC
jgi:uncharacterized protein (DUF1800 family)